MKKILKQFLDKQLRYSPFFHKRLKAVQALEKLDTTSIRAMQEEKFLSLLHKAYHQSPFYTSLYRKHGVKVDSIRSVQDLHLLPTITKQDIVRHYNEIFIGNKLNRFKTKSSGTSGLSVTVYRDYQSVIEEGAYQWAHRISFGHYPGMKTVVIRGNLNMQEKELYDPFTKTLYLSSFQLNMQNADWYFNRIREFAPNAIFAYPSSVESLANFFNILNKQLHVPLIFTSSETLYSYQREKVEKVFNARIADWYGNAERTIALRESQDGLYDQIPLYSINEYQEDYVITTGLINFSFPLIRYKVDDVILFDENDQAGHTRSGDRQPTLCRPGRHRPATRSAPKPVRRVKEIQGRSDDVLILPDGTRVGLICNAFDGIDHILLSQVVQENPQSIHVNLVVDDAYSQQEEKQLIKQLEENIGKDAPYTLRYVSENEITKSKNGKFKLIVNKMQRGMPPQSGMTSVQPPLGETPNRNECPNSGELV